MENKVEIRNEVENITTDPQKIEENVTSVFLNEPADQTQTHPEVDLTEPTNRSSNDQETENPNKFDVDDTSENHQKEEEPVDQTPNLPSSTPIDIFPLKEPERISNEVDLSSSTQAEASPDNPPKNTFINSRVSDFFKEPKIPFNERVKELEFPVSNENKNPDLLKEKTSNFAYYPSVTINQSGSPRFNRGTDSLGKNLFTPVKFEYQPPKGQAGCVIEVHFDPNSSEVIDKIKDFLKQIQPCCRVKLKRNCIFSLTLPLNTELATSEKTDTSMNEERVPHIKFDNTKDRNLFMGIFGMAESDNIKINEKEPNIVEIYPSFFLEQQKLRALGNSYY